MSNTEVLVQRLRNAKDRRQRTEVRNELLGIHDRLRELASDSSVYTINAELNLMCAAAMKAVEKIERQ